MSRRGKGEQSAESPSELLYNYQPPDEPKARQYVLVEYSPPAGQPALLASLGEWGLILAGDEGCVEWALAAKGDMVPELLKPKEDGSVKVHGRLAHFRPKVHLDGGFVEGETVQASITFPDLPAGHAPVSMRFVTSWQREDVGTYWLTHGEAMARAKLRQRGHYEAVGEQAFFIPTIDSEPLDAKRFLPIESEEVTPEGGTCKKSVVNTLKYECSRHDIGCRLRFVCQPVDMCGHLGRVIQAVTPHIICPFPRVRRMYIRDAHTGLSIATKRLREAAELMSPTAEMLNAPVMTRTLHLVVDYVGGDEGESLIQWYRLQPSRNRQGARGDTALNAVPIARQVWLLRNTDDRCACLCVCV